MILVLKKSDQDHVRAFLDFLGCSDRPLCPANDGRGVRVSIGSAALANRLRDLGVFPGRSDLPRAATRFVASRDFWRGVIDGDGSLKLAGETAMPSIEVVGAPALIVRLGAFLSTLFSDGFHPRPFKHSQSTQVLMVKVGGRRADAAARHLYYDGLIDALPRKLAIAQRMHSWEPQVLSRYPWQIWADGREWSLARGSDYQKAGRVWEAGRQFARRHGLRFELRDLGDSLKLRFSPREESARNSYRID